MSGRSSSVAQSQGSETGELWFLTSTVRRWGGQRAHSWLHVAVPAGLRGPSCGIHARTHTLEREKPYLNSAQAAFDNVELRAGLSQPMMGKVCDGVRDSGLSGG